MGKNTYWTIGYLRNCNIEIVIFHFGQKDYEVFASSCLFKGLHNKYGEDANITLVLENDKKKDIFRYNKSLTHCFLYDEFWKEQKEYDLLINLSSRINQKQIFFTKAKNKIGFYSDHDIKNMDFYYEVENGIRKLNMTLLQFYYKLAGMTWHGQGYDIGYYPKTKSKENRCGLALLNLNLKHYVLENFNIEFYKPWHVPYRKNVFKKMDEINKSSTIVTDDMLTLHCSIALRKYVYYLQSLPINMNIEFFKMGEIFKVPLEIIQ